MLPQKRDKYQSVTRASSNRFTKNKNIMLADVIVVVSTSFTVKSFK